MEAQLSRAPRTSDASATADAGRESDAAEVVGRRVGAGLVDAALLFLLFVLLGLLIGDSESGDGGGSVTLDGAGFLVFAGLSLLYYFILEATTGQTLGKRLLGIRVRRVSGGSAGPGAVAARTVLRLVDSLPFLYLLGFIVMIATPRRQRIGDLAAGTTVARA
jgi:uncharacterized RDD family membrane protein YckC